MRRLGQLSLGATTLLLMLLMLLVPVAIAESSDDFVDGERILIQHRSNGEWVFPSDFCLFPNVPKTCFGTSPGVTGSKKIWTVREQSDGSFMLEDSEGTLWKPSDLPTFNRFPYVTPSRPTSHYAFNVEDQVNAIVDGDYDQWDVEPNYGTNYNDWNHTQGIAITDNGFWVQTQSAAPLFCDLLDGPGVVQSIDPIRERDRDLLEWTNTDVCDPHPSGAQACGNVVAVQVPNKESDVGPEIRFFEVDDSGDLTELTYLKLPQPDANAISGVGLTHINDVGYFLYTHYNDGEGLWFRGDLDDHGAADHGWRFIPSSGNPRRAGQSGISIIMEGDTLNMYFFTLGPDGASDDAKLMVIRPSWGSGSSYAFATPTEYWKEVAKGADINRCNKGTRKGLECNTSDDCPGTEEDIECEVLDLIVNFSDVNDDLTIPFDSCCFFAHSFRWGGDVHVNEAGRLEFLQAPRDFYPSGFADIDQPDYAVLRSETGDPVNPVTQGRIKRIKCIEETADGPGDDEVYLITNFWRSITFTGVDDETEIEFRPFPYSFFGEFTIKSSSKDGTYVYLMEDDSDAAFGIGERPETIGKIFIPPAHYARPGTHRYTATLRGDDGEYEVTYEIIKGVPPVADAGGPYTVNEGDSIYLDGAGSSVGGGDTLSFAWDLDDDGEFDDATGATPLFSAALLDDGFYVVGLRVEDGLDFAEGYASVTVVNVDPTVSATGDVIDENGIATVSGNIVDPGILDTFTLLVDWGEGAPMSYAYAAGATEYSETHQYLDDDPSGTSTDIYPVSVTVTDDDGGIGAAATQVTVNNVVPTATIDAVTDFAGNVLGEDIYIALVLLDLNMSASFMDVGSLDTHSVVVDWADGTVNGGFTTSPVSDAHAYLATGNYTIAVTVTDDDTGTVATTKSIEVVDAAGAVADLIERLTDFANDPTQDPAAVALVEDALDELNGNNGGQASNGVLDKLENGNWNAALVKISKVIELLLEADASPMTVRQDAAHGKKRRSLRREVEQIAGTGELELSVAVSQLVLSAKSTLADLVRIAKEEAKTRNDWRRIAEAEALIGEGDQLFADGDAIAAVALYRTALTKLH